MADERICRQVASLLALTTSKNAGEAANARAKVRELVKAHRLTRADVEPHCAGNQVAEQVARLFAGWSEPPPAPAQAANSFQSFYEHLRAQREAEADRQAEAEAMWEAASWSNPFHAHRVYWDPVSGWGTPPDTEPPGTYFIHEGMRVRVEDVAELHLRQILSACRAHRARNQGLENDAHNAINAGDYASAQQVLNRLQLSPPPQPLEIQKAILDQLERRLDRGKPYGRTHF